MNELNYLNGERNNLKLILDKLLINKLQRRIAQISVGASALRNQGAKGIVGICRKYFENSIDLKEFRKVIEYEEYKSYLDEHTDKLLHELPEGGKSWGAARKGLNLFFRDVVYNFYLANHLEIPSVQEENKKVLMNLEVPLDKDVATGLIKENSELPRWKTIKTLTKDESELYQNFATKHAEKLNVPRIHLDLEFWRKDK